MPWQVSCPHCHSVLNVTEKALGQALPCPSCKQMLQVPQSLGPASGSSADGNPRTFSDQPQHTAVGVTPPPAPPPKPLPVGMPPPPQVDGEPHLGDADDSWGREAAYPMWPGGRGGRAHGGFTDMFLGKDKRSLFRLIPGEERVDEMTVHHRHLFFIEAGITRVTLSTHRILYTETRVFSPVYWLLLVLFPPLIFYYAARISRNRYGSIPLGKVDSVEKGYRANWGLLILSIIGGVLVLGLCDLALSQILGDGNKKGLLGQSPFLNNIALGGLAGVLTAGILALLLANRDVAMLVVSGNNKFSLAFAGADFAGSQSRFDTFVQRVFTQVERARALRTEADSPAT